MGAVLSFLQRLTEMQVMGARVWLVFKITKERLTVSRLLTIVKI